MRQIKRIVRRFCIAVVCLLLTGLPVRAGTRDALWKQVAAAKAHGLPKTAITNLTLIFDGALRDKAYAEAAKAMAERIGLEAKAEHDASAAQIIRLQTALPGAPAEMGPILHTILANWYWQYYQNHQWQFAQRTATAAPPGKDFTAWDSPRLFGEIGRQFQAALSADPVLKAIPVADWRDLLEKGAMPDAARPTLYDFIVHEALDFYYRSWEPNRPDNPFEVTASDPVFDSVGKFLAWRPQTTDTNSSQFRAVQLWQDLLRFHQHDAAPAQALAAADLDRLGWAGSVAGNDAQARYTNALEQFIHEHEGSEISSLALDLEAMVFYDNNDRGEAHRLAEDGAKRFPDSAGGKSCQNLLLEIEEKFASISTDKVWAAPWPKIEVTYRNIDSIELCAIPVDWKIFLDKHHHRPEQLSDEEIRQILRLKPALEWSASLPRPTNYEQKTFGLPVPETLKPGFYMIGASHKSEGKRDSTVAMTPVWVTDLALVSRTRHDRVEGFITLANSGEPVAGAEISVWHLDAQGNRIADPNLTTDSNGFFGMAAKEERGYLLRARSHGQEIANQDDLTRYDLQEANPQTSIIFFTDRRLYRPDQEIQYKAICFYADPNTNRYEVLAGKEVTVIFRDANGDEVARQTHRANEYGSFSGSFTAPRNRLTGEMTLSTTSIEGQASFRVEEYKRPKFEVTLDPPDPAPKLGGKVRLKVHAMSYTGAAVDGATVKYNIMRQSRLPDWCSIRFSESPQEITHGSALTGGDGTLDIMFDAVPSRYLAETNGPIFDFTVSVDVTDGAGETRSGQRTISIGYAALKADLAVDEWQTATDPVKLEIATKSLDDNPQAATGEVKIYALQAPPNVIRGPLESQIQEQTSINWPLGPVLSDQAFVTGTNGEAQVSMILPVGIFRAVLESRDQFGKAVTAKALIRVIDPNATSLNLKIPELLIAPKWEAQPGETFTALWGTGYKEGRACVEIEQHNRILQRYWTEPGRTEQQIKVPVTEAMRGGFTMHLTQIRENRPYFESRKVDVPWRNKELAIRWEHFTSKLEPAQKETWTAVITGPRAESAVAEMVATLYDESLDAFEPLVWQRLSEALYQDESSFRQQLADAWRSCSPDFGEWEPKPDWVSITYRHFPEGLRGWQADSQGITQTYGGFVPEYYVVNAVGYVNVMTTAMTPAPAQPAVAREMGPATADAISAAGGTFEMPRMKHSTAALNNVTARKNLNETAFFFPQLVSDTNGVVRMTFTMPEALTRWHFMALAHDQTLRSGFFEAHAVTAKDLMVQPNPPRFLREGDTVEFTVKVSNQSEARQVGTARLNFHYAPTNTIADADLGNDTPEQSFDIPPRASRSLFWRVHVPDGCGFLSYKVVGATDKLSDGEDGLVPILSRRVLVTESIPLWAHGPATNRFRFDKLLRSGASATLHSQSLTVQMASNPAWYAVMALPYLMEFPHECSEQTFNRFYANALAGHIANSDPGIRRVFDRWLNTPALDSPLEKNQDLKAVTIEETPWLNDARNESQSRRQIGILFDNDRVRGETAAAMQKLLAMRLEDGRWPWFPGGEGDDYLTLYILTGFGRLRHLGVNIKMSDVNPSLKRMDQWASDHYRQIQKFPRPNDYVPASMDAMYLYCRSFFARRTPTKAAEFFLGQARKHWLETDCRQSEGQLALALYRTKAPENVAAAQEIMKSLKERSASSGEMGMYWNDPEPSWWWYRAPIETQALLIEAFDEVVHDKKSVEACRLWLLTQKQTQNWKTTKATADAIYALLLRGSNLLSEGGLVTTEAGSVAITPAAVEPGTGFYEQRFAASEIKPAMGDITVAKPSPGLAWGGMHWQFLEDLANVTAHQGTPLKLKKSLYRKVNTDRGPVLQPIDGPLHVGDELVVRLELRADRDMEYVHLKDQRGSGAEPVNVLSGYKYQDGLAYYESTRDTASHFFINYLPKGVYVFEYSVRIQLRGEYQSGLAEIECMYAPEFNSHSESILLAVAP